MVSLSGGRTTASICAPAVILEPLLPLPAPNAFRVLMESRHGFATVPATTYHRRRKGKLFVQGYYGDRKIHGVKRSNIAPLGSCELIKFVSD
ncbi:unnamed protein product [Lasius platythorax]|uniref:Uncharacterized protein n=1 Tax=Lasius platythorax TaxID=488582 RepID=A0AAV2PCD9_9HYME